MPGLRTCPTDASPDTDLVRTGKSERLVGRPLAMK